MRLRKIAFVLVLLYIARAAVAQSATSTTLAITSGGVAVATVKEETVVTLTAAVVAGSTPVTRGVVEFCDAAPPHCSDIHLLGTAQLTAGGTAVLSFFPAAGTHTYEAVFVGTNSARTSSASATLMVTPFYPTFTLITYPYFLGAGTYSLDVSVTGTGGTSPPTGTVSILDTANGNYVLGTATLMPGGGSTGGTSSGFANYLASSPSNTGYAAVADFNGDGKADLAVANYLGNNVLVMLGSGSGTFSAGQSLTTGATPVSIAVADFNGDGKPDMAVVNFGGYNVAAVPPPPPPPPLPPPPPWFVDPILDAPTTQGSVAILMGNGDGTFAAKSLPISLNPAPTFVVAADFNGDGIPDLAVTNSSFSGTVLNAVNIFLGVGDGSFTQKTSVSTGGRPICAVMGDFNGDGFVDLVVGNADSSTLTVLLGNGDGTFRPPMTIPSTSISATPTAIVAGDFNGDGILDLAVTNYGSPGYDDFSIPDSLTILLGKGDGTFRKESETLGHSHLNSIAVGDFNADGKADLVVSDYLGVQEVMLGNEDGTFAAPIAPATAGYAMAVVTGDFNGDGVSDIASPSYSPNVLDVLIAEPGSQTNTATATTTVSDFFVVGTGNHNVVASYSGDSTYAPSVSATEGLFAQPEPTMVALTSNPATSNYGQQVTLTAVIAPITAQNHSATGTVKFTFGNTVVGTSPIVGGVATFNTSLLPAGVDSVTATYSGDTNFASSSVSTTETVNGSASATVLTVAPNPALVGQTVTLSAAVVGVSFSTTPTGSVTFYNGTTSLGQVALDAAGQAKTTLAGLPFGSYTITAVYSGDTAFYTSTSPLVTLVVAGYVSATTITAAPNPAGLGQPLALTAGVTGIGSATIATGVVTFYDGASKLGQGTLDASGHASVTTSALALGTHSLTAVYGGSAIYSASTSAAFQETVQTPGFTVTLASPTLTLATYHHLTTSVTLASAGDFSDKLTLSCGNAPANVTCIFTPTAVALTANGLATVSFYIDTDSIIGGDARNDGTPVRDGRHGLPMHLALLLSPMGLFAAFAARRRRRVSVWMLAVISVSLALAVGGCGGSIITPVPSTAPGVYAIAVTATGATSGITHAAQLTLTVTP